MLAHDSMNPSSPRPEWDVWGKSLVTDREGSIGVGGYGLVGSSCSMGLLTVVSWLGAGLPAPLQIHNAPNSDTPPRARAVRINKTESARQFAIAAARPPGAPIGLEYSRTSRLLAPVE